MAGVVCWGCDNGSRIIGLYTLVMGLGLEHSRDKDERGQNMGYVCRTFFDRDSDSKYVVVCRVQLTLRDGDDGFEATLNHGFVSCLLFGLLSGEQRKSLNKYHDSGGIKIIK